MPALPDSSRPLLVTADPALLDDLLRLAAAAAVEVDVAHAVTLARPSWPTAPVVLVGADAADELARRGYPRRAGVVLVGHQHEDGRLWPLAVTMGAEHVALLPDAEAWLVDRLADALEGAPGAAVIVCVLGGRGGAGASVLAAALAQAGAHAGRKTLLVDADPLGGGVDLVLGQEHVAGSRWSDFLGTPGRLSCAALRAALPAMGELAVLSLDRDTTTSIPADAMRAVLAAADRGCDLVVLDLPRHLDDAAQQALGRSTVALLVVPAEVRATVAAARVAEAVRRHTGDVRVVVRGPAPTGLDARSVVESLALPLAGEMDAEPGLATSLDRGDPPLGRRAGPLGRFCERFLAEILPEREGLR